MGRSKRGRVRKRACWKGERIRHQPKGNKFEAAAPLICLVLSVTDKLGKKGEKIKKELIISPARAPVREEKLYQLARLL